VPASAAAAALPGRRAWRGVAILVCGGLGLALAAGPGLASLAVTSLSGAAPVGAAPVGAGLTVAWLASAIRWAACPAARGTPAPLRRPGLAAARFIRSAAAAGLLPSLAVAACPGRTDIGRLEDHHGRLEGHRRDCRGRHGGTVLRSGTSFVRGRTSGPRHGLARPAEQAAPLVSGFLALCCGPIRF
jgi:hypothetical protein